MTETDPAMHERPDHHIAYIRRERLHRQWWRRPVSAVIALVLIAVTAGCIFLLSQRNASTEVALDEVVERYAEAQQTRRAHDDAPARAASDEHVAARVDATGVLDPEPARATRMAATRPAVVEATPYSRPPQGIYSYATTGGEKVSTFGASHEYPNRTYLTLRHLDGCRWEARNDVVEEHVDTSVLCSRPKELLLHSQGRKIEFFGQEDGSVGYCDPPLVLHKLGERPGAVRKARCIGEDPEDQIAMTRTFLGSEHMTVGGRLVEAVHIKVEGRFSGRANGASADELWLSAEDGLVLRWERSVDTMARAWGANVRYQEQASFVLESLQPRS